jgi:hypothetical protein
LLQDKGISTFDDHADLYKNTIEQIAANLRYPAGRVPDPNPEVAVGATILTPPFVFGANSQIRLINSTNLLRYSVSVGRNTTAGNLQWTSVMKNFSEQWKALEDKKGGGEPEVPKITKTLPIIKWTEASRDYLATSSNRCSLEDKKGGDEPEVPKITKALPIIKWTEAVRDYLHRVIGVRNIPLAYAIRPEADVPPIGAQAAGTPHSTEHEAIETELIARAAHGHALFREDNLGVYYKLEEATRATSYATSIKPFQRTKNGRMAWQGLSNQFTGNDKWEAKIKRHEQLVLHTRLWKGQSNCTLERSFFQHPNEQLLNT